MSEPRSDLRLRELGREAQDLVDLPDLGSLSAVAARCGSGVRPESSLPRSSSPPQASSSSRTARPRAGAGPAIAGSLRTPVP